MLAFCINLPGISQKNLAFMWEAGSLVRSVELLPPMILLLQACIPTTKCLEHIQKRNMNLGCLMKTDAETGQ